MKLTIRILLITQWFTLPFYTLGHCENNQTINIERGQTRYIVYFNLNDCSNCLNAGYFLSDLKVDKKNVVILTHDLHPNQLKGFQKMLNLHDSFSYISDIELYLKFSPLAVNNKSRSWIVKSTMEKNELLDISLFTSVLDFDTDTLHINFNSTFALDQNSVFFGGVNNFVIDENFMYALTFPKSELNMHSLQGAYVTTLMTDSTHLNRAYDWIMEELPDSVKMMNNFKQSKKVYDNAMLKMGFRLMSVDHLIKQKSGLFVIGRISLPIQMSKDNYVNKSKVILFKLDPTGDKLQISQMIKIEEDKNIQAASPMIFSSNFFNWRDNEVQLGVAYVKWDSSISSIPIFKRFEFSSSTLKELKVKNTMNVKSDKLGCLESQKNLSVVLSPIVESDDLVYFKFEPLIMNQNGDISPILKDIELKCNDFKNILSFKDGNEVIILVRFKNQYRIMQLDSKSFSTKQSCVLTIPNGSIIEASYMAHDIIYFVLRNKDKTFELVSIPSSELTREFR